MRTAFRIVLVGLAFALMYVGVQASRDVTAVPDTRVTGTALPVTVDVENFWSDDYGTGVPEHGFALVVIYNKSAVTIRSRVLRITCTALDRHGTGIDSSSVANSNRIYPGSEIRERVMVGLRGTELGSMSCRVDRR